MSQPADTSGFIEPTVLPDHGLTVGRMFVQGAGFRVATWDGDELRTMSAAAAKRLARDLITGDHSVTLKPVHDALMAHSERITPEAA